MNWRDNSMARFYSISRMALRVLLAGCVLLLGSLSADAKTKKPKPTPTPTPAGTADKDDIPIPIGHGATGVRIPIYGPDGKLQMMFDSEIAFRLDQQQLRLTQLKIETYDETDGKPEMSIDMPNSIFNLKTRILSSVDPVTIRRSDFEVNGGNMTFDTQTKQGKFTGPVRMLVFKSNDEAQKSPEGAPHD